MVSSSACIHRFSMKCSNWKSQNVHVNYYFEIFCECNITSCCCCICTKVRNMVLVTWQWTLALVPSLPPPQRLTPPCRCLPGCAHARLPTALVLHLSSTLLPSRRRLAFSVGKRAISCRSLFDQVLNPCDQ